MMLKCPSDCDHPYLFLHSFVTTERIEKAPDGQRTKVTTDILICRECGHWTEGHKTCRCPFRCHEEAGVWVTRNALAVVS